MNICLTSSNANRFTQMLYDVNMSNPIQDAFDSNKDKLADMYIKYLLSQDRNINNYFILNGVLSHVFYKPSRQMNLPSLNKFFIDQMDGEINHVALHWQLDPSEGDAPPPMFGDEDFTMNENCTNEGYCSY